ncbi:Crp/Fnr family transcriptional regulator [Burkholderiaceae bacterium FT117]|uniref:Crp/Fnr family transcriptional regulator n=1 Tax=Zeimonas sediminis TaxID=2944268 RepID=UPI002343135A|nr:Crp/Fnr family transcriptional regulator [Zeimonas sediminis]MCM5570092.1 Crp/Fnr family transcriptional regulator [Zeimonas sediminis]
MSGRISRSLQFSTAVRAGLIAATPPFVAWPDAAIARLAEASRLVEYPRGALLAMRGGRATAMQLIVSGNVEASSTDASGRRFTFRPFIVGQIASLLSFVDGREMPNDVLATEDSLALEIPYAAIRAELDLAPGLWESIAMELGARARLYTGQIKSLAFDSLRSRMASLLLDLAETRGECANGGATAIKPRLPQEKLAEMLGVSRQTATAMVKEMSEEGLLKWRYGRVELLDLPRLRGIARMGVDGSI